MAKHTQTIRRQIADELFECVRPFCEFGAYRVKILTFLKQIFHCYTHWKRQTTRGFLMLLGGVKMEY